MQKLPFIRILASKINVSFDMKSSDMESIEDLLLNANDVPERQKIFQLYAD